MHVLFAKIVHTLHTKFIWLTFGGDLDASRDPDPTHPPTAAPTSSSCSTETAHPPPLLELLLARQENLKEEEGVERRKGANHRLR